jgi:hypothetical protein
MNDDWSPLGFQVVGYDGDKIAALEVSVGKEVKVKQHNGLGIVASGQTNVINALGGLHKANPQERPVYEAFSLQDAIAYSEFLISATASHQRFARTTPTVGGEIDIALVTPFDSFQWIQQKKLFSQISGGRHD